jgi:hypothetical protein
MLKEKLLKTIKKYFSDFFLIFISVFLAFSLSEWSNNQNNKISEEKIFLEILNGLEKDSIDLIGNIDAHKKGTKACNYWRRIISENKASKDSLIGYYYFLTRNVIFIQNRSGYETLKSKGLETIKNDSLRTKIISLYEFDYQVMKKFEEDYKENQFFDSYFFKINEKIAPNIKFDSIGNIKDINLPLNINSYERNILLSYLWKIQMSRMEREFAGKSLKKKINTLYREIYKELKNDR